MQFTTSMCKCITSLMAHLNWTQIKSKFASHWKCSADKNTLHLFHTYIYVTHRLSWLWRGHTSVCHKWLPIFLVHSVFDAGTWNECQEFCRKSRKSSESHVVRISDVGWNIVAFTEPGEWFYSITFRVRFGSIVVYEVTHFKYARFLYSPLSVDCWWAACDSTRGTKSLLDSVLAGNIVAAIE